MTAKRQIDIPRAGIATAQMHLLLLGVGALLWGLAYPRVGWWWSAHVALAPMAIVAMRSRSVRTLTWTSFLVGFVWWLVMIRWLTDVTFGGYAALSAIMALYLPATLLIVRTLDRRWRLPMVLAIPMAWVSMEFVRGHLFAGGFGWFALSHAMAPWRPGEVALLIQIAEITGEWGVSFLVAMSSGVIVDLLTGSWKAGPKSRGERLRSPQTCLMIWFYVYLVSIWFAMTRFKPIEQPPLNIGIVQTNVPQDNKSYPTPEKVAVDWARMLELTERVLAPDADGRTPDLIAWPETMVPAAINDEAVAYFRDAPTGERGSETYHDQLRALAAQRGVWMLVGAHAKEDFQPVTARDGMQFIMARRRYNTAYLIPPDPNLAIQRYDKVHRVPFGEYVPWVSSIPPVKRLFMRYFTPYDFDYSLNAGEKFTVLHMGGESGGVPTPGRPPLRIAAPICYEDAVPRVTRRMCYDPDGTKRVDLLVNLTNDGWYPGSAQGQQHFQIAVLRCVENRVPMVRAVNTGVSGLIDSYGNVRALLTSHGQTQQVDGVLRVDVPPAPPRVTFFGRYGSLLAVINLALTAILTLAALPVVATLAKGKRRQ